jgi:cation:H+ antiporter
MPVKELKRMVILLFVLGLVALIVGAELLVRGASDLALAVGMPPLIIGLTVVALGTSAPELAVCIKAGVSANEDIAVGNVVGSNTINVLFILGTSALIAPLAVRSQLVRLDVPVMIVASGMVWILASDGLIGNIEGVLLVLCLGAYTVLLIYLGKRPGQHVMDDLEPPVEATPKKIGWSVLLVVIGLGLLVIGSEWLVQGAVAMAELLGISQLVIGLTIVAGGTSLPEVATSIMASVRGQRDIAVGNVVGSNVYNLWAVLGGAAIVSGQGIQVSDAALQFDVPVMMAVAVACLPIFFTGGRISRWEGGLFLGYYIAYLLLLFLSATQHAALPTFKTAMIWFVIPITILGIAVSVVDWIRQKRSGRNEAQSVK